MEGNGNKSPRSPARRSGVTTLEDVAQAAGVTRMTVSRVISGKGHASAATQEKILRIAAELNYTANQAAIALTTGRTGNIAIIGGRLNRHYYTNIVQHLESQLNASGYQMKLLYTRSDLKELVLAINSAVVDGVIIVDQFNLVEEFRFRKPQFSQPCVYIDAVKYQGVDCVHNNVRPAFTQALEHIISLGRKRIAYASNSRDSLVIFNTEQRRQIYLAFMGAKGLEPEFISARPDLESLEERIQAVKEHIQKSGCPEAIVCKNDEIALLVCRAVLDAGYRISEDVVLLGCDGLPFMT
ncbi:LacI family transcriptional regulator, partial [bacterium]